MVAIGGSIRSVSIAGRLFAVAADAESNRKLGGYENEVQANGNGSARLVKTNITWMLDGIAVSIDDSRGDLEFLQEVSDSLDFVPVAITYASGITYQGQGQLNGEFNASSQNATAPVTLMGTGKLTKQ